MIEHQHIISCHHKEMQTIRESLHMAMEKFESLFEHSVNELKDFKTYAVCTIGVLNQKVASHETTIQEQRRTIEALYRQLLGFQDDCATRVDMEKLRKSHAQEVKANTEINIGSFQLFQREFKNLIQVLESDLAKLRSEIEQKLSLLTDKTETNFYVSRIDKDGVLKEIRTYDKTIFIIEKKIENLYTLIERLNNRGTICHKPE
jgi:uncharacterized coiled-coil protein SlyX